MKGRLVLDDSTVEPEEDAPSAKAKDNIARISDVFVESAIFYETLGLESLGIGIDLLVTSHTPFIVILVNGLAYFEDKR
jgi:hypothetical protein